MSRLLMAVAIVCATFAVMLGAIVKNGNPSGVWELTGGEAINSSGVILSSSGWGTVSNTNDQKMAFYRVVPPLGCRGRLLESNPMLEAFPKNLSLPWVYGLTKSKGASRTSEKILHLFLGKITPCPEEVGMYCSEDGGGIPMICHPRHKGNGVQALSFTPLKIYPVDFFQFQPRPVRVFRNLVCIFHRPGGFAGIFNSLTGKHNLLVEEHSADRGDENGCNRCDNHPERPKRTGFLSREVASLIVATCFGGWVCYRAFNRAGKSRNVAQTLGWALVVAISALFASYGLVALMIRGI